ncbi:autotransporter-associated beta strand repeat-containing protein [Roseomonas chloroacetimidivorans]|uniref:autotransporter-associated beta strand repeat-containing protein n=1 Tax=Roseomonas chloroacetimidivorans TaxID=1766656 RepID=UPI003C756FD7
MSDLVNPLANPEAGSISDGAVIKIDPSARDGLRITDENHFDPAVNNEDDLSDYGSLLDSDRSLDDGELGNVDQSAWDGLDKITVEDHFPVPERPVTGELPEGGLNPAEGGLLDGAEVFAGEGLLDLLGGPVGVGIFVVVTAAQVISALGPQTDTQRPVLAPGSSFNPDGSFRSTALALNGQKVSVLQVGSEAQLVAALTQANGGGNFIISLTSDIQIAADLPVLNSRAGETVVLGNGHTLDGNGQSRGFVVDGARFGAENLVLKDLVAQGDAGASGMVGGGGGAGLGGGVAALDGAQVVLRDVSFNADSARGGAGGNGTSPDLLDSGNGVGSGGGMAGAGAKGFGSGGAGQAGGGWGGGGGGWGAAGAGGGAGGQHTHHLLFKDNGAGGGGGAGAGGALFADSRSNITVLGGSISGGTVSGGAGGLADGSSSASEAGLSGSAAGSGIFIQGGQVLHLGAGAGETQTVSDAISDESGSGFGKAQGSVEISGSGRVVLSGTNSYTGSTVLDGGTLEVAARNAVGSGTISFGQGARANLVLDTSAMQGRYFDPKIVNAGAGDTIDVQGVAYAGAASTIASADETEVVLGGQSRTELRLQGSYAQGSIVASDDGHGGTLLSFTDESRTAPVTIAAADAGQGTASGTAAAGGSVTLFQLLPGGSVSQLGQAKADANGNWSVSGLDPIAVGSAKLIASVAAPDGSSGFATPVQAANVPAADPAVVAELAKAPAGSLVLRAGDFNSLAAAIRQADGGQQGNLTIMLTGDIRESGADLPAFDNPNVKVTLLGGGHTLNGGGTDRGLFVFNGNVDVKDLTISDTVATGGRGGDGLFGGGGGAGLGGAVFVGGQSSVSLENVTMQDDKAVGGAGGNGGDVFGTNGGSGGGGGLGGDGGNAGATGSHWYSSHYAEAGGGGGIGRQAIGGTGGSSDAYGPQAGIMVGLGNDGQGSGDDGGSGGATGIDGEAAYSGGGGGIASLGQQDGGDGSGIIMPSVPEAQGGTAGWGGGGGGGVMNGAGGDGGFGGGGGGNGDGGGNGGWGAGGGGGSAGYGQDGGGQAGFGAGKGGDAYAFWNTNKGGGGGLGAGGGVFVQAGSSLSIIGGSVDGTATGGAGADGGGDGQGLGGGMFIQGTQAVGLGADQGAILNVGAVADEAGSASSAAGQGQLVIEGQGTVVLTSTSTFTGGTLITSGTLELAADRAAGSGEITFAAGADATLKLDQPESGSPNSLHNVIGGMDASDSIDITGLAYQEGAMRVTSAPDGASLTQITVANDLARADEHLTMSALPAGMGLTTASDGHGGTLLKLAVLQQAAEQVSTFSAAAPAPENGSAGGAGLTAPEPELGAAPLQDGSQGLVPGVIHDGQGTVR